jgi:hypothetical protein
MASELKVDKFTGVTTAGSILVTGEGNSTTTSLQQGLCKFFSNIDGDAGTISTRDSFNQSGITDNGSGDYTFAFTNNMANDDYSHMTNADSASGHLALQYGESEDNTNNCRAYVIEAYSVGATDSNVVTNSINGDLA